MTNRALKALRVPTITSYFSFTWYCITILSNDPTASGTSPFSEFFSSWKNEGEVAAAGPINQFIGEAACCASPIRAFAQGDPFGCVKFVLSA